MRQGGVTAMFTPRIDNVDGPRRHRRRSQRRSGGCVGCRADRRAAVRRRGPGQLAHSGQRRGQHARRHGRAAPVRAGVGDGQVMTMTFGTRSTVWRSAASGAGFTFIELLIVSTILIILASAVMPLAKVTNQRQKEAELRRALREMRTAIDKFKDAADAGHDQRVRSETWQRELSARSRDARRRRRRRRTTRRAENSNSCAVFPIDPFTGSTEWGLRAYQDRPDSMAWGGQNVYDIYTKAGRHCARRHQVQGLVR